jgi:hypothetical protein
MAQLRARGGSTGSLALLACLIVGTIIVACGGPKPSASPEDQRKALVAYAQCMREHGLPNFPDPVIDAQGNVGFHFEGDQSFDPDSPAASAGRDACESLLPTAPEGEADRSKRDYDRALKYSACMRSHGVADFPDPQLNSGGGVSVRQPGGAGSVDRDSATFHAAEQACQSLLPGGDPSRSAP